MTQNKYFSAEHISINSVGKRGGGSHCLPIDSTKYRNLKPSQVSKLNTCIVPGWFMFLSGFGRTTSYDPNFFGAKHKGSQELMNQSANPSIHPLLPILHKWSFPFPFFPHKISKSDDIPAADFSCGNTALAASAKPKLAG